MNTSRDVVSCASGESSSYIKPYWPCCQAWKYADATSSGLAGSGVGVGCGGAGVGAAGGSMTLQPATSTVTSAKDTHRQMPRLLCLIAGCRVLMSLDQLQEVKP